MYANSAPRANRMNDDRHERDRHPSLPLRQTRNDEHPELIEQDTGSATNRPMKTTIFSFTTIAAERSLKTSEHV